MSIPKISAGFPTGPNVPFLDPDSDLISQIWYQFLVAIWKRTGSGPGQTTVTSVLKNAGDVTLVELIAGGVAPLLSPALIGTPTAPTAALGDESTQIANTAFVGVSQAAAGAVLATLDSPAFSGVPTAPTASFGTNNTQIATTQFVSSAAGGSLPASSVGVGVSPFNYVSPVSGSVLIAGGTVTSVTLRRGFGATYPTGVVAGSIRVSASDTLTVTYTTAPAVAFFPS